MLKKVETLKMPKKWYPLPKILFNFVRLKSKYFFNNSFFIKKTIQITMRFLLVMLLSLGVMCAKAQNNNTFSTLPTNSKSDKNFHKNFYESEESDDLLTNKMTISVGYGAPRISFGTISYYFQDKVDFTERASGPYFFKIGYGISKNVEVGLNVNLSGAEATFKTGNNNQYQATVNYTSWSALGRVNFHFFSNETFSSYVGLSLGYRNFLFEYTDNSSLSPSLPKLPVGILSSEVGIGARYFFLPNVGLYAEVGLSRTVLQGGLTFRF